MSFSDLLELTYFGNTVRAWLLAAAVAGGVLLALVLARHAIITRLTAFASRTPSRVDDAVVHLLRRTRAPLIITLAVVVAAHGLLLPPDVHRWLDRVAMLALFLQMAIWINGAITFWVTGYTAKHAAEDPTGVTTVRAAGFIARLAIWSVIALLVIRNVFGIDVTALIAGLGITGVAVALAVQNILGDLLAALSIVMDKPFVIGDFIIVDSMMGTVEHVGLKTTRLRSLSGEEIIAPNGDLLKSRIRNFKRMYERRVVLAIGVVYDTPPEVVERIPGMIRGIIESQQQVRVDRSHFKGFGAFSLDFEAVYFVTSPDYTVYMNVQQAVGLTLMRAFAAEGIQFAYPTQTLHLTRVPAGSAAGDGRAGAPAVMPSEQAQ